MCSNKEDTDTVTMSRATMSLMSGKIQLGENPGMNGMTIGTKLRRVKESSTVYVYVYA